MMKTSFQVFSNRFASNISQNFKIFLKYLVRSEVLLSIGNKKKSLYLSLVVPLAGACPSFLSVKQQLPPG